VTKSKRTTGTHEFYYTMLPNVTSPINGGGLILTNECSS